MNTKKSSVGQKSQKINLRPDMPLWLIVLLAAIAMPRVVVHDLHLLPLDSFFYILLAVVPFIIYGSIAIFRDNKRPLYDFMIMGVCFGVFLATIHLITWDTSWGSNMPKLGDNLEGVLAPEVERLFFQTATAFSSVMTGIVTGAVFGLIAVLAKKRKATQVAR